MKRFIGTLLLHILAIVLICIAGWLLAAGWYGNKFDKALYPIMICAALPALISAFCCVVTETVLWRLSVNPAIITMLLFVVRIIGMLIFSAIIFVNRFTNESVTKADKIAFVLIAFCCYGAILFAHIISNIIYNNLEENK